MIKLASYTTPKKGNMKRKPKTSLAGSPDVSKMVIEDNVNKESKNPKVEKVYVSFIRLSFCRSIIILETEIP